MWAARKLRNADQRVLQRLAAKLIRLPEPLQKISRGLLFATTTSVHAILGLELDAGTSWRLDARRVSEEQVSRLYSTILCYYMFLLTQRGKQKVPLSVKDMASFLTDESSVVDDVLTQLQAVRDSCDSLDFAKLSACAYSAIRKIVGAQWQVEMLMCFSLETGEVFKTMCELFKDALESSHSQMGERSASRELEGFDFSWAFAVIEEQRVYMSETVRKSLPQCSLNYEPGDDRGDAAVQLIFQTLKTARFFFGDPIWLAFVGELGFKIIKTPTGFTLQHPNGVFHLDGPMFESSYATADDNDFYHVNSGEC